MSFRKLPLKMVLKQEFSFYSLFALAPCLFGRSARKSCAFCTGATTSVAPPLHQVHFRLVYSWCIKLQCASITSHSHLHTHKFHLTNIHRNALGVRVAQQMSLRQCKTRNFCAHFAQTNTAQVHKGNKKRILVSKPSSRITFKSPFKTALNVRKKFKTGLCP